MQGPGGAIANTLPHRYLTDTTHVIPACYELDRNLRSNFHHAPRGDLEEVGGVARRLGQGDEQVILPERHARLRGRLERAPRQEEGRRHDVELPTVLARNGERPGHVRGVHESEAQIDTG